MPAFSFVGFAALKIITGDQSTLNVTLAESIMQMEEIVVAALGIKRQTKALSNGGKDPGDALTTLDPNDIETISILLTYLINT